LRFVGTGLAATGLYLQFNWAMMLTGLGLAAVGLYLGWQQERSEGLDPEYAMLPRVGDEIRSEKGYVVRRVENGLQYCEGGRSLMLRNDQLSIRCVEVPHPDGSITNGKSWTSMRGISTCTGTRRTTKRQFRWRGYSRFPAIWAKS
jgi:hypothetical protein